MKVVDEYEAITQKDRFDCAFIDDFPTLTRIVPPGEVRYRRVPDEAAIAAGDPDATKVLIQQKDPIEGRRVNIFTYNAEAIDTSINYLRAQYASFFDATTHILRQSLINVEIAFMQTPWPVTAFLFLALSWAYTNRITVIFVASSLAFLAVFELWQIAMQTMALVVVATAICVFVGLPTGIWMAKNKWFRWITEPVLDVMQTIPSLSYLVPAVAFFGISQPPAVLATVIFAIPPMVKLTALGILQVPESTKEAALAFGASERQLLRKVELPMAFALNYGRVKPDHYAGTVHGHHFSLYRCGGPWRTGYRITWGSSGWQGIACRYCDCPCGDDDRSNSKRDTGVIQSNLITADQ